MSGEILVIGAANTDLTAYVDRIPEGGETIHGNNFTTGFGGKGANQAVAAKRAGANVALIAGLGADIFGENTKVHWKLKVLILQEFSMGNSQVGWHIFGLTQR